jgi:hypothetical protein
MSKVKSPGEKKRLSLKRDRRNTFGESPHASRKNIRRGKQRSHQEERRFANQVLATVGSESSDERKAQADATLKAGVPTKRLHGFKKEPDTALGEVVKRKHAKRKKKGMSA